MSDLISRSELIEELKSLKIVLNGKQIFSDDAKDTVLRIVNEQATAYDVDKVVEELEKISNDIPLQYEYNYEAGLSDGIEKAIEIVKQDGVSDDVCEWEIDGIYLISPHNRYISCVTDEGYRYNYCPECGKKIKAGVNDE